MQITLQNIGNFECDFTWIKWVDIKEFMGQVTIDFRVFDENGSNKFS